MLRRNVTVFLMEADFEGRTVMVDAMTVTVTSGSEVQLAVTVT